MSYIEPLSLAQTQHLAHLYHSLDVWELADAIEEFICDYGYDETEHDDVEYTEIIVQYPHRAGEYNIQ
jgi:hypothetical protein